QHIGRPVPADFYHILTGVASWIFKQTNDYFIYKFPAGIDNFPEMKGIRLLHQEVLTFEHTGSYRDRFRTAKPLTAEGTGTRSSGDGGYGVCPLIHNRTGRSKAGIG